MNKDLFHFVNGCETLKEGLEQIMPSYFAPTKIGIRPLPLLFRTHFAYHQETFSNGIELFNIFGSNVYVNAFLCIW